MSSSFNARNAEAYDRFMGRWSRELAEPFLDFAGVRDGEDLLDVGCGTGSLLDAILDRTTPRSLTGIDYSDIYVAAARARIGPDEATIRQGDACAMPFDSARFDRALSLLVLHFIPQAARAIAEMRRVTRPGGTVAAAVWDGYGGFTLYRMFYDTVSALGLVPEAARQAALSRPMTREGELQAAFRSAGLIHVTATELHIRMRYRTFDDLWGPIAQGEAALGQTFAQLDPAGQARLTEAVRAAYLAGQPDGPRSFAATAWACRGTVPALPS